MPNVFTATKYYLSSIPTLLTKTNFLAIPISILQTETLIRAGGLKLLVRDLMDIWTIKEVILDHQYEHYQQIGQNDTVVDIGGGVGDFSIKAGAKAKIVYSYEIDPNRLSLFYKNLKLNGSEKVTVIEKKALSLDQILDENQITKCDFFKIDCEGCEYEILLNSSPQALQRVGHIAAEVHLFDDQMKQSYKKLTEMLSKNGFDLVEEDNPVHANIIYLYATHQSSSG